MAAREGPAPLPWTSATPGHPRGSVRRSAPPSWRCAPARACRPRGARAVPTPVPLEANIADIPLYRFSVLPVNERRPSRAISSTAESCVTSPGRRLDASAASPSDSLTRPAVATAARSCARIGVQWRANRLSRFLQPRRWRPWPWPQARTAARAIPSDVHHEPVSGAPSRS